MKFIELKLLKIIKALSGKLPLIYIYLQSNADQYQHVLNDTTNFASFFNMLTSWGKSLHKLTLTKDGVENTFLKICPICLKKAINSKTQFIIHLILNHLQNFELKITYFTQDQVLQLHLLQNTLSEEVPDTFKFANFIEPASLNIYFILHLYQLAKCTIYYAQKQSQQLDQNILNLMKQKKFYHGPEKQFREIFSPSEFQTLEQEDLDLQKENLRQSVHKCTPSLKKTPMQNYMIYYNEQVLDQQPQDMKEFMRNLIQTLKDQEMLICCQNHLYVLMCYNMLDQRQFQILLNLQQYSHNINEDPLFDLLPLQPTFYEELKNHAQNIEKAQLFQGNLDGEIPKLKKSREDKRMRKMAKLSQLTDGWFGMKQQQQDDEAKNQYLLMKLKKYIDPKQPLKSSEFKTIPKYFQVGTYVDGMDNFNLKGKFQKKKKQHESLVDQFLELDNDKNVSRRKFQEIQTRQQKIGRVNSRIRKLRKFSKRIGNK